MDLEAFLAQIRSEDAEQRYKAWRGAGPFGAKAVVPLAELAASPLPGVAKAAREALQVIVHHAGRPGATDEARAVAAALLSVAESPRQSTRVRADALHWLGFVGDARAVPGIARLLNEPGVRDEARMALERIPGRESLRALRQARDTAPADFKAHLEQSLRARALTPATVGTKPAR